MEEGSEGKRGNTKETGVVVYSNLTRNGRAQRGVRARVLTSGSSVGPLLCSGPKRSAVLVYCMHPCMLFHFATASKPSLLPRCIPLSQPTSTLLSEPSRCPRCRRVQARLPFLHCSRKVKFPLWVDDGGFSPFCLVLFLFCDEIFYDSTRRHCDRPREHGPFTENNAQSADG